MNQLRLWCEPYVVVIWPHGQNLSGQCMHSSLMQSTAIDIIDPLQLASPQLCVWTWKQSKCMPDAYVPRLYTYNEWLHD